jgi:hypothetical protein
MRIAPVGRSQAPRSKRTLPPATPPERRLARCWRYASTLVGNPWDGNAWRVQELQDTKRALEAQVLAMRNRIELIERKQAERRALDDKRRQEELAYLKHQAKHLDLFLKSMPRP